MISSLSFDKAGTVKGSSLLPIHGYRFVFNMMSDLTTDARTRAGGILVLSDRRDDWPRSNSPVAIGRADPGCGVRVAKQAHEGAQDALRLVVLTPVPDPLGGPDCNRQARLEAHLAALERAGDEVLQHLDELVLGHLRVDVHPKPAMHVALRRHHLAQPALRLLDGFGPTELVRKHHFRIDHQRKVRHYQLAENPRKGRV